MAAFNKLRQGKITLPEVIEYRSPGIHLLLLHPDMNSNLDRQAVSPEFAVYDCEIHLKFRLIEEKQVIRTREQLLELLLDAFSYGADEYMEPLDADVKTQELSDMEASPQMRRQLIRLRNSRDLV